jgi:uncharacterized protein (TIGR03437 family)
MNRNSEFQNWLSGMGRAAARFCLPALLCSAAGWSATFGAVVPLDIPVGGHVSDIVLDEPRGVLYAANFTARRIEVVSIADQKVIRKIDVPAQPGAMALSPDGTSLVVAHFGGDPAFLFAPAPAASCPLGAMSVIDLSSSSVALTICADTPLAAAFGNDGLALIALTNQLLLLDPRSGATQSLGELRCGKTINGVSAGVCGLFRIPPTVFPPTIPPSIIPLDNFPAQILGASITAAQDGFTIYGQLKVQQNTTAPAIGPSGVLRFRYDVRTKNVVWLPAGSSPGSGPSTVSVNRSGSRFMAGWGLFDSNGSVVAQFHNPTGDERVGSHVFDTIGNASYPYGVIYAQVPDGSGSGAAGVGSTPITPPGVPTGSPRVPEPVLMLVDADNLTVRERIQLPENLSGRSLLNSKRDIMYSASESGVLILPVGSLASQRRLAASKEDIVFRPDVCRSGIASQTLDIVNPGGGRVGFAIVPTSGGIRVSPSTGFTPAHVTVSVDPGAFQQQNGTTTASLLILSLEAINIPNPVRVLINTRQSDQRGTFLNVPGTPVDLLADPARDRFYVLRQEKNDVLVYDSKNNNVIATMRTSSRPTQMTLTMDRKYLLVGHEDSQFAYVYDLDTLQPVPPDLHILFPVSHYPKSIAATNTTILAASRFEPAGSALHTTASGRQIQIDAVDFPARRGWTLPSLGIYQNYPACTSAAGACPYNTALASSPDGRLSLAALSDGNVFLYNDTVHTFTTSRKDFTALAGAFAASNNGQYVVGNHLMNSSLVPIKDLDSGVNPSSGFVFVNNTAFRTSAALLPPPPPDTSVTECVFGGEICVTKKLPGTGVATFPPGAITPGSIQTVTNLGPDKFDPSLSDSVRQVRLAESPLIGAADAVFTRTLAALRDQSALVLLTQSGLTIMPWNYDAPLAIPQLDRVVNSADQTKAVAPGGLISVMGRGMPTALGDACLTVNGTFAPLLQSVSPTQVNAQLPFDVDGNARITLYTTGGKSDNLNITILPAAPSVFRATGELAADGAGAMVYRGVNNSLVSAFNPVRDGDDLVIFGTGLGQTSPAIPAGDEAPADPLSRAVIQPEVSLDGIPLRVDYAGLTPGGVGVYQINAKAPSGLREGQGVPLTIRQGGMSTTLAVQVAAQ